MDFYRIYIHSIFLYLFSHSDNDAANSAVNARTPRRILLVSSPRILKGSVQYEFTMIVMNH